MHAFVERQRHHWYDELDLEIQQAGSHAHYVKEAIFSYLPFNDPPSPQKTCSRKLAVIQQSMKSGSGSCGREENQGIDVWRPLCLQTSAGVLLDYSLVHQWICLWKKKWSHEHCFVRLYFSEMGQGSCVLECCWDLEKGSFKIILWQFQNCFVFRSHGVYLNQKPDLSLFSSTSAIFLKWCNSNSNWYYPIANAIATDIIHINLTAHK